MESKMTTVRMMNRHRANRTAFVAPGPLQMFRRRRLDSMPSSASSLSVCKMAAEGRVGFTFRKGTNSDTALLLIHPIGVGLSRSYWNRFLKKSYDEGGNVPPLDAYAPDLLGCGELPKPQRKIFVEDIADELVEFVEDSVQKPVIIFSEGALATVAILVADRLKPELLKGLIMTSPPPMALISGTVSSVVQSLAWAFFTSPLGALFYKYARRREFLRNFTQKNLFSGPVDEAWLDELESGAQDVGTRWAVFSFLAGFWRQDYRPILRRLSCPVLAITGTDPSVIASNIAEDPAESRISSYRKEVPTLESQVVEGRNTLSYEHAEDLVDVVFPFVRKVLP